MRRTVIAISIALISLSFAACDTKPLLPISGDFATGDLPDAAADLFPDTMDPDVRPTDVPVDDDGFDVDLGVDLPLVDVPVDTAAADALQVDVGDADVRPTDAPPADDGTTDFAFADALPSDLTLVDVPLADLQQDAGFDACTPVLCDLFCPFGFRTDWAGCEVCQCRECSTGKDCNAPLDLPCPAPMCGKQGMCTCDCTDVAPKEYLCPDGTTVPWCACGPLGWDCVARPEERCPALCKPGTVESLACPDGSSVEWCLCKRNDCVPECRNNPGEKEGWYDPCAGNLLAAATCATCRPVCKSIGTRSEGWYSDCDDSLIEWQQCGPARTCNPDALASCPSTGCTPLDQPVPFVCPDGTQVPHCGCKMPDGTWECSTWPWTACANHPASCTGEGGGTTLSSMPSCCPGLTLIEAASWDGQQCMYPDCLCAFCTYCGDGLCIPPENRCNCRKDCLWSSSLLPQGGLCSASTDCAKELACVLPAGGKLPGVCTIICNPMAAGPRNPCGTGFSCVTLPDHQALGFCLEDCPATGPCPSPLECGAPPGTDMFPKTCFPWNLYAVR
jgi:hypothetical protein